MASPTRLYKVFGYITCGYTRLAFDAVKQTAATTSGRVGLHPESSDFPASPSYTEYADFKNWLAKGEGLAAAIPPYHTTSPACFDDDDKGRFFSAIFEETSENNTSSSSPASSRCSSWFASSLFFFFFFFLRVMWEKM